MTSTVPDTKIPLVDLLAAHAEISEEIEAGFARVLQRGDFIKGSEVRAFEAEYSAFVGLPHCIGVANGTDAIELALRATELPADSEVVLPANTFIATASAVVRAGLRPILSDIAPDTFLIDVDRLSSAIGPNTSAVMPVHLYGQMAPMTAIANVAAARSLVVVEDAAQAQGATQSGRPVGFHSAAATTSFYPGKNLGAYGDAGAVLTSSEHLARLVRLLGDHGSERRYEHLMLGFNSRLDSLQAVVLRAKLQRLAEWNARRSEAAARYHELLNEIEGVVLPTVASDNAHVWHLYVIRVANRDRVLSSLNDAAVGAAIHYPVPVHLHPAFRHLGYAAGDFPVAEQMSGEIISLPIYPHITERQQVRVAEVLKRAIC
jgi:dTDP-4-amino-4,6-dideoxygalactose transaminase